VDLDKLEYILLYLKVARVKVTAVTAPARMGMRPPNARPMGTDRHYPHTWLSYL